MKKYLFTLILCFPFISAYSQEVDTLYFDNNFNACSKVFSDYMCIYEVKDENDTITPARYRVYYSTGELRGSGFYLFLNKSNLNSSKMEGEYTSYYKNGKKRTHYNKIKGLLEGEFISYTEDGLISFKEQYKNDKRDGVCYYFGEDGKDDPYMIAEYKDDNYAQPYVTFVKKNGYVSKINVKDKSPYLEEPSVEERKEQYIKGECWNYYNKNGLIVKSKCSAVSDYGNYYQVYIYIANVSLNSILFDPELIYGTIQNKKGELSKLESLTCDEYMIKVKRKQSINSLLNGLSEGLAAAGAGYSSSSTYSNSTYNGNAFVYGTGGFATGSISGNSNTFSSTSSYNGYAAYQASVIASNRIADYDAHLISERNIREEGYLKKTTINPGESVFGYINIKKKKQSLVNIFIPIENIKFEFNWDVDDKPYYDLYNGYNDDNIPKKKK